MKTTDFKGSDVYRFLLCYLKCAISRSSKQQRRKDFVLLRGGGGKAFEKNNCEFSNYQTCPIPASGRPVTDNRQVKTRKMLKIGTWNIRTLRKPSNYHNLKAEMAALQLDILGIAESRWIDDGKISDEDSVTFYFGGNKLQCGVGIKMRKSIASCITGYWPISDRLIMLKLGGAPFNINIKQAYAPTLDYSEKEVEEFYESIRKCHEAY